MRGASWWIGAALLGWASAAWAGPPYLTDDPVPTAPGHWEIYNFVAGEGHGSTIDGSAGFDLNYGPMRDVQLTATLPLGFSHGAGESWRVGSSDVELGVKYRFGHDEQAGFSAAIFPRIILPTAARSSGEKARFLLPLWLGKDLGAGTSIFGGGGFTINRCAGNRDYWQAGAALTEDVSKGVSIGGEITRQGSDTVGGTSQTRLGVGSIVQFGEHQSLLLSAGPTWSDHRTSYRFYAALGLTF